MVGETVMGKINIGFYLMVVFVSGGFGLLLGLFGGYKLGKFFTNKQYEEELKELEDRTNEC